MSNQKLPGIGTLAAFFLFLSACAAAPSPAPPEAPPQNTPSQVQVDAVLYGDRSGGNANAEELGLIKTETVSLSELTVTALAQALSQWTGLDFTLNGAVVDGTTVTVDWAVSSTLTAGLDDREQKEAFFFHDQDSLRWFMMDSLYLTLQKNLGAEQVYYTMDGGKTLTFTELSPTDTFPSDIPYMGSPFYFAHADGKGELDEEDSPQTSGGDTQSLPPVLMRTGSFTGLQPLETNNSYDGGYFYSDMTQEPKTVIINCCFSNQKEETEPLESYIRRSIAKISGEEPRGLFLQGNEDHTKRLSYPVHLLTWKSGEDGDSRRWSAFFFMTDTHTYFYAFNTPAAAADEMEETWQSVFHELHLSSVS